MSEQEKQTNEETYTTFQVFRVVSLYIVISITMIIINKAVLNEASYPLTILFFQLFMAVIPLHLANLFGLFTIPPVNWSVFRSCVPLVGINTFGLAFNTLCLNFIDAVLFQVARSLVLPMTVILQPFLEKKSNSWKIIVACVIIFIGFVTGMFGEKEIVVSPFGILFGILSSITSALHPFIIKQSYSTVKNDPMELVYYNNLFSAMLMLPLLVIEYLFWTYFIWNTAAKELCIFIMAIFLSGISGLLINVVGFLQIKITSPLTHIISTTSRGAIQSITAHILLNEALTVRRSFGIGISLFGSGLYSYVKYLELPPKQETQKKQEVVENNLDSKVNSV